jgi:hypothetical protein
LSAETPPTVNRRSRLCGSGRAPREVAVDPPPAKEERPRREHRRFEDVDANGDERVKGDISSRELKNGGLAVNGDSQSWAMPKVSYRI